VSAAPRPRLVARAVLAGLALALLGACADDRHEAPAPRDDRALSEPISVRMGTRDVRVRCALSCERARDQLTLLRDRCVADPTSTPHHLDPSEALIALGCCTEAATAYERACGDEVTTSCRSRWSAECDSGRIGPR